MKKVKVENIILTDLTLTHKAFYLYATLKEIAQGNSRIYIYKEELMDKLRWNTNKTLKTYLKELKKGKIIDYDFDNIPINKALKIDILVDGKDQYVLVDTDTIEEIKQHCQNVKVEVWEKSKETNTTIKTLKEYDLKELSLRLFYYYEMCYNKREGYARPTYQAIKDNIGASEKYIKAINNTFQEHNIVKIILGKKYDNSNKRMFNKYIPLCKREKENS